VNYNLEPGKKNMTSCNKRPRKEKDMMNIKFNYEEKNVMDNSFELGRKICGVQQL